MDRLRLTAVIALLAAAPIRGFCGEARVADVRVGRHGDYERIVVELQAESEVAVRWIGGDSGADIFEIAARPLLARQLLSTGRPRVGEMLLLASENGAELRLEPRPRRTRAFLLSGPPRLVIDIATPGEAAFDAPADVHAILRESADAVSPEAPEVSTPAAEAPSAGIPLEPRIGETPAAPAPALEAADAAAAEPAVAIPTALPFPPPAGRPNWMRSRALIVPVLAGIGVLLLAVGGLALASAQRSRPVHRAVEPPEVAAFSTDRLDLLEKRLDEEVRARMQIVEQLAQAREELGGMRDLFSRLRAQAAARSAAPSAPQ